MALRRPAQRSGPTDDGLADGRALRERLQHVTAQGLSAGVRESSSVCEENLPRC